MKQFLLAVLTFSFLLTVSAQDKTYLQSLMQHRKNYINSHEVVKAGDRKFMKFYKPNEKFRITAAFEKINDSAGFMMPTSGKSKKKFYRYGYLRFEVNGKSCRLTVFRSDALMRTSKYRDQLFIPFTDLNSGGKSYGGGKYIDIELTDISGNIVTIDFNKAYNPYCAYAAGFNCPIPPRENALEVGIDAGEMDFAKKH